MWKYHSVLKKSCWCSPGQCIHATCGLLGIKLQVYIFNLNNQCLWMSKAVVLLSMVKPTLLIWSPIQINGYCLYRNVILSTMIWHYIMSLPYHYKLDLMNYYPWNFQTYSKVKWWCIISLCSIDDDLLFYFTCICFQLIHMAWWEAS